MCMCSIAFLSVLGFKGYRIDTHIGQALLHWYLGEFGALLERLCDLDLIDGQTFLYIIGALLWYVPVY